MLDRDEYRGKILDIIGPAVLLAIPAGEKAPKREAWQKLTPADMTPEYLASLNHGDNIGVSLGKASNGLCRLIATLTIS